MVKLWDAKLVKLRNEMNIHAIVKRIGEKAETAEVKENFDAQAQRIESLEESFIQIINEVEGLQKQGLFFNK